MKYLQNGLLAAALFSVMGASSQAQQYTNGQVGTFGNPEIRNAGSNANFDQLTDSLSVRFTAMEAITIDRAWQNLGFVSGGTPQLRVGIMADNGSGNPSGTYLTSGTFNPVDGGNFASFGSIALIPSTTYHLVYQLITSDADNFITISSSNTKNTVRPYDRAVDANFNTLFSNNGGAWVARNLDPYFFFANGPTTNVVAGPGQPYRNGNNINGTISVGANGNKYGQVFTITDKEIAPGKSVAFNTFTLSPQANATAIADNQTMIVKFRDLNNNVLASTSIPASQANGTAQLFTLNQQIELQQGVPYLFTTEFASFGTVSETFSLRNNNTVIPGLTGMEAAAGWGGTNLSYVIKNKANGGNTWIVSDFDPVVNGDIERSEILFSFQGIVVPEPSAIGFLLCAGVLLFWQRKR